MTTNRSADAVFIVGQTASGKTDAALALASALPGAEIVNCDSRQVYRGMSIGTAKPTADQCASVPHHVIDVADPVDGFSLAEFLPLARSAIHDILARGAVPIVVGGTGQYVWGLVEGWEAPSVPPQAELRDRLEREAAELGVDALHERLASLDPDAAKLIEPRNVRRVVRALEVIEVTGESFSSQRKKRPPPFTPRVYGIAIDRNDLHARIALRIAHMLAQGWLDEVQTLLNNGCTPELPAFSSAGYRDMAAHLRGEVSLAEAVDGAREATRRLAKSQSTWFRRADQRIAWMESPDDLAEAVSGTLDA